MWSRQHLLFALLVAVSRCFASGLELTPKNWEKRVRGKQLFIKFFAPWCAHCKKLKPDWDRLSADFYRSPHALVADVDCIGKGKSICERNSITGYPTLMWGEGSNLKTYVGPRTYPDLKQFADEQLGASCGPGSLDLCDEARRKLLEKFKQVQPEKLEGMVKKAESQIKHAEDAFKYAEWNLTQQITSAGRKRDEKIKRIREKRKLPQAPEPGSLELTPENWDAQVAGKVVFLKFYAPWCGHCKAIKPAWDKLMADYAGTSTAMVAEIDCTNRGKSLCEKHGVTGYPRLMWGEASELTQYRGGRQYDDLKEFAEEFLGKACSPVNLDVCGKDRRAAMDSLLKESPETRDSNVRAAEKAIKQAEQEYQDVQWNLTGQIDVAELKRDEHIKTVKEQGLAEAKMVNTWNKKQPPGFWEPAAVANQPPASEFEAALFRFTGLRMSVFEAVTGTIGVLALVGWALLKQLPLPVSKSCTLRQILTKTKEEILMVKEKLDKGEDFGIVASECSICGSAKEGGNLGRRSCGSMTPAIDTLCFNPATKLGDILGPVETDFGFHLLIIDEREGVKEPVAESAKDK